MSDTKTIQVGDEVEALCGTCKAATVHVVEVVKNDKITKVMCKSCMSSHRYRLPEKEAVKKVAAKKTKSAAKKPTKTKEQRKWSRVLSKVDSEHPTEYSMGSTYNANDVIEHSKFGVGVVIEVVDPYKVAVVFEQGQKTLVQNRS